MEATTVLEKTLGWAILYLPAQRSRPVCLRLPGEPLPGYGGEAHQEDGNHLTDVPSWLVSRLGWASTSWKSSSSITARGFHSPEVFVPGFLLTPLPEATGQLFNHAGGLFQARNQMKTIKHFAGKKEKKRKIDKN